jgi:hypothetical protein
MRLSEITDQNRTLIVLLNLSEDYSNVYAKLEQYARLLIQQKTPMRNKQFIPMFNELKEQVKIMKSNMLDLISKI